MASLANFILKTIADIHMHQKKVAVICCTCTSRLHDHRITL